MQSITNTVALNVEHTVPDHLGTLYIVALHVLHAFFLWQCERDRTVINELVLYIILCNDIAFDMVVLAVLGDNKRLVVCILVVQFIGTQLHVGVVADVVVIE